MEWMFMPFKRYADFSGRSRRKEYWMFTLFLALVFMAIGFTVGFGWFHTQPSLDGGGSTGDVSSVFSGGLVLVLLLFALAIVIPNLAVQVRRFHDQDKSGWMILLGLIPVVGGLIIFVFMCLEGTRGPNRFGPDPKGA